LLSYAERARDNETRRDNLSVDVKGDESALHRSKTRWQFRVLLGSDIHYLTTSRIGRLIGCMGKGCPLIGYLRSSNRKCKFPWLEYFRVTSTWPNGCT